MVALGVNLLAHVQFGCEFISTCALWAWIHHLRCNLGVNSSVHVHFGHEFITSGAIWVWINESAHAICVWNHLFVCNLGVNLSAHVQFGCEFISSCKVWVWIYQPMQFGCEFIGTGGVWVWINQVMCNFGCEFISSCAIWVWIHQLVCGWVCIHPPSLCATGYTLMSGVPLSCSGEKERGEAGSSADGQPHTVIQIPDNLLPMFGIKKDPIKIGESCWIRVSRSFQHVSRSMNTFIFDKRPWAVSCLLCVCLRDQELCLFRFVFACSSVSSPGHT